MKIILKPGVRKALQKTETAARRAAQATYKQMVITKNQAENALEQAQLRARVRELQRNIDQQMQNVGELIYATYQGHPSDSDDVQKILEYTDRLYKEMRDIQKEIHSREAEAPAEEPAAFREAPRENAAPEEQTEKPRETSSPAEDREIPDEDTSSPEDAPKP